jgi:arabinan endo-1,5-alpha-L-arabinosidase
MVQTRLKPLWLAALALGCAQSPTEPRKTEATAGQASASASARNSEPTSSQQAASSEPNATTTATSTLPDIAATREESHSSSATTAPAETAPTGDAPATIESSTANPLPSQADTTALVTSTATASDTMTSSSQADPTCGLATASGESPTPLSLSGNTFAHDPTMLAVGGTILRFWTGEFVPSAQSTDLFGWTDAKSAYAQEYPSWVNTWKNEHPGNTFNFPWAPDASYFGGKYHLYVSFSAFFGRNSSCITHLTADDPVSGNWTDQGPVLCSEESDSFNAIDADVGVDAAGAAWLAFGSFWDGIHIVPLTDDGERKGAELTQLAWAPEIEAPVLFYRCGYYYLFVSWGLCCPGEGRSVDDLSYRVAVGRSENIVGPYVDRDGVPLLEGGGSVFVRGDGQEFAAAGHSDVLTWNNRMYHVYHAYRQLDGGAELRIVELTFDDAGWPIEGPP